MKSVFKVGDRIRYHGKGVPGFHNPNLVGQTGVLVADEGIDSGWDNLRRWKVRWDQSGRTSAFGVCEPNMELLCVEYKADQEPMEDEECL